MKHYKKLLCTTVPLLFAASACVLDVDTHSESLTVDQNPNFGINDCGQSLQFSLQEAEWPIDSIVAGDMEYTKEDLIDHLETNPGARSDLIAEMAAAQLNMAVALEVPNEVLDDLAAADRWLAVATGAEDEEEAPPPVIVDGEFGSLRDFNRSRGLDCFDNPPSVLEVATAPPSSAVVDREQTQHRRLHR